MRSFLAGFFLFSALAMSFSSSAMGQQVDGQVLQLGFNGAFRGDCWTPLKVQLKNHQNDAKSYMIQIHQQDLDKDTVVYTRVVPLGPSATTDFWVYFIPQPTGGGIGGKPLGELLKVYLYDESGKTLINQLPLTFPTASDIDPPPGAGRIRGQKLVLAVTGANDNPSFGEYNERALGLSEGVNVVPVRVDDLPGSVLGLQAVDAIVWFDAEAREISSGGTGAFEAIQQYVKEGGQLVICQPAEKGRISAFADAGMLPVEAKDASGAWLNDFKPEPKPDLEPLYGLAVNNRIQDDAQGRAIRLGIYNWNKTERNWDLVRQNNAKAFEIYRAKARPDAVVDVKVDWGTKDDGTVDETPYIARRAYGSGSVVWVAQDLGSRALTSVRNPLFDPRGSDEVQSRTSLPTGGWPYVWDKVFGWNNRTIIGRDWFRGEADKEHIPHPEYRTDPSPIMDVGESLASGMEASARGAWLVTVAIFFFIVYWIIAGPGSYFFLAHRKRKGLSWGVFAAAALVATLVTVGVVKLVLRGDPEVHHVTVCRLVPDAPAADGSPRYSEMSSSRFGLYIPRDGVQTVELTGASTQEPSYVVPLHARMRQEDVSGFTDTQTYTIATDAVTSGDVSVGFPYRSTLKKIQTQWTGTASQGITGTAQLIQTYQLPDPADPKGRKITHGPLKGTLTNGTGRDLHDVYIAYRWDPHVRDKDIDLPATDWVLYLRSWPNGATIDLDAEWAGAKQINTLSVGNQDPQTPMVNEIKSLRGEITSDTGQWYEFWVRSMKHAGGIGGEDGENDAGSHYARTLPLMAFFDRLAPYKAEINNNSNEMNTYRADLQRHGGRGLNVSQLIACGRLVVVAQADGVLPYPMKVDGSPVGGEGVIFFEVALPLDDKQPRPPATRPTTKPTTKPAKPGKPDGQPDQSAPKPVADAGA